MGDDAVIVRGTSSTDPIVTEVQREALYSTVHGAGRVMSRTAAAEAAPEDRPGAVRGQITPEMMQSWVAEKGVVLRGGGLDESLMSIAGCRTCWRPGPPISAAHPPVAVMVSRANEFDPYKD
jgi:tRNA-splicing ligase RtcB